MADLPPTIMLGVSPLPRDLDPISCHRGGVQSGYVFENHEVTMKTPTYTNGKFHSKANKRPMMHRIILIVRQLTKVAHEQLKGDVSICISHIRICARLIGPQKWWYFPNSNRVPALPALTCGIALHPGGAKEDRC